MAEEDLMFMSIDEVKMCIMDTKIKNSEGYDHIPQRVLVDGCLCLLCPLTKLFSKIYMSW